MGNPKNNICQSCAMPMNRAEDFGTKKDGGVNTE